MRLRFIAGFVWFCLSCCALDANAQTVQLQPVISGLSQPVFLTHANDGSGRLFILELPGIITILHPDRSTTPFLDIRSKVRCCGERGLLGLAFHSRFRETGRFFVNYTRVPDGATVVAEYRVSGTDANQADTAERVLLTIPQPFENHNGGMIAFGPDGYLYIGMGDGGSGNDPQNRAQNVNDLLGKMLRIDIDRTSPGLPYANPETNPFFGPTPGADEIYAVGFRNPWRFSFDRVTGQLLAGDVGQNAREEIDLVVRGGNYGWRVFEGNRCTNLDPARCDPAAFVGPITEYINGQGGGCSVTGGYVYRGLRQTLPQGAYVYGDFCTGVIYVLKAGVPSVLMDTALSISSFGEDESGEIYVVNLSGQIFRLAGPAANTLMVSAGGAVFTTSSDRVSRTGVGYVRVTPQVGQTAPSASAVLTLSNRNVVVSETAVPAGSPIQSGRLFAEFGTGVDTGVAFANPQATAVTVQYFFTNAQGLDFGAGSISIPPFGHVARFLSELPGAGSSLSAGSFTFDGSAPIAALAIRGRVNARGDFLMSTTPLVDFGRPAERPSLPYLASGGGWASDIVLVNPTSQPLSGTFEAFDERGGSANVMELAAGYRIAPRSSVRFPFSAAGALRTYSVRVVPASGQQTPHVFGLFNYTSGGVLVTEATVTGVEPVAAQRMLAVSAGSLISGLAVHNASASTAEVRFELFDTDGGIVGTASLALAPRAHRALFLNQLPGVAVPPNFYGVVRVTSDQPSGLSAIGLRSRVNDRGDFLISTVFPVREDSAPGGADEAIWLPHYTEGGGFRTEIGAFSPDGAARSFSLEFVPPRP